MLHTNNFSASVVLLEGEKGVDSRPPVGGRGALLRHDGQSQRGLNLLLDLQLLLCLRRRGSGCAQVRLQRV